MARVLYDGLVEYEDKTPATTSQMAKDVVEFLNWSAEPEMDQRKKMGVATIVITSVLLALSIWVKRLVMPPYFPRGWVANRSASDTNGLLSRREKLSTTPPLVETLGAVGSRALILAAVWWVAIEEKIVQSACTYRQRFSCCLHSNFQVLIASMTSFSLVSFAVQ